MTLFSVLEWFQGMDRRFVFFFMAVFMVVPMVVPMQLAFEVDERVQSLYDQVEQVPPGSTVLISADFDPASRPELEPFFRANLDHLFRRDVRIVMVSLWPYAPQLVTPIFDEIAARHDKTWGEDYVFLGYKAGKELAIKLVGENLYTTFPEVRKPDGSTMRVEDLPIMQGHKQAKDFPLLVNVLNFGHLYIIALILLGNVAWFLTRPRDVATGGKV